MALRSKKTTKKKTTPAAKAAPSRPVKPETGTGPSRAMSPFEELEHAFERAYGRFFPHGWMRPSRWELPHWADLPMPFEGKHPRVDVIDQDEIVVIKAEIPGVEKKDLDVSMTENTVTIRGTVSHEKEDTKGDYYRKEMSRGMFSRTVQLPTEVDGSKADASYKDGVLELKIPKVARSKRRKVTVK